MNSGLANSPTNARMATTIRHPANTINTLFHDAHAANRRVRELQNTDLGGGNGVNNHGNTELGKKFQGQDQTTNNNFYFLQQ